MTRFNASFKPYAFMVAAAWWLPSSAPALAANDFWDTAASGVWQTGSNWLDNTTPAGGDTATFNLAGAYMVTFNGTPPAIRVLGLSNGVNATFTSIGAAAGQISTLRVNSASGSQNVHIQSGSNLSLGTSGGLFTPSKPLHLTVGNVLSVASGSTLNVRFGSDVVTSELSGDGQVNVSGAGSTLNVSSANGIGVRTLNATAGGVLQTSTAFIGSGEIASVSGSGSQWIATGSLVVDGEGTLNITAGGKVQSLSGIIGAGIVSDETGFVTVSGDGSQWNISANLVVGDASGVGRLDVTGGGSVSSVDGAIGVTNAFGAAEGTATVTGGAWTMTGRLSVGGEPNPGPAGQGTLNIQPAGIVSAAQGVILFPDAHVNLQGGTLDASAISYHEGIQGNQFQWTSGTLHVGTFNGNLTNQGGTLAPGSASPGNGAGSTTIDGNYTQQLGGALEIEIGGSLAVSEFDFVNVTGNALLDGELELSLINGFLPTPSQTFAILIASSVQGAFDNALPNQRVATSDGLGSFLVHYGPGSPFDPAQIVLSSFQAGGLLGDYNQNGVVDAADYTVWRDTLGSTTNLAANGNGNTLIDAADYNVWKQNFGRTSGGGAGAAVPEPGSAALVACGLLFILRSSSRRRFVLPSAVA